MENLNGTARKDSPYRSARQGLWLVIDIIDDLRERDFDVQLVDDLTEIRGRILDLLFYFSKLERLLDAR